MIKLIFTVVVIILIGLRVKIVLANEENTFVKSVPVDGNTDVTKMQACGNGVKEFFQICYFTNWSKYRTGKGHYEPANIDPTYCTHIVYAFALLKNESLDAIVPSEPDFDEDFYKQVTELRKKNKKVCLGLGGWNDSTPKYGKMMADPKLRAAVVKDLTEYVVKHNFDCADIDIEYPGAYQGDQKSGVANDKENFLLFLRELRDSFDAKAKELNLPKILLSVAVSANEEIVDIAYDVKRIAELADWIGAMTYDYHGKWDTQTALNAPFVRQPEDPEGDQFNVVSTMDMLLKKGAPPEKLIVGVPFYARSFRLTDPKGLNGIGAPAKGDPEEGEFTKSSGFLAFYEIIDNVKYKDWDVEHVDLLGTYAVKGNQWGGFDDKFDVAVKATYVKLNCFLGTMVWSLDLDCFQDTCPAGKYPLLSTIHNILTGAETLINIRNAT